MTDLPRHVRKVQRATGCEITILEFHGRPFALETVDEETGQSYLQQLGTESRWEESVRKLHEAIYRERGREVFRRQKGMCAICGSRMAGTHNTETDHINTRGAHGRDDRISNLRVVHGEPCHRERHTKSQGRTA